MTKTSYWQKKLFDLMLVLSSHDCCSAYGRCQGTHNSQETSSWSEYIPTLIVWYAFRILTIRLFAAFRSHHIHLLNLDGTMIPENPPPINAKRKTGYGRNEKMYRFSLSPSDGSAITSGENCTLASEPTKYDGITSNGCDGKRWKYAYYSSRLLPYMLSYFLSFTVAPLNRRGY